MRIVARETYAMPDYEPIDLSHLCNAGTVFISPEARPPIGSQLFHGLPFAILVTVACFVLARRRWVTSGLVLLSFHLHLFEDVLGARGPDGYQWPIPYLAPFSQSMQIMWSGQWALNAWPNFAITTGLLALTFVLAWKKGFSPLEMVSVRADGKFVEALRARFGAA